MILAALATLLGASVQSATGLGFALVAGPALFAVLEPREAVSALLLLGVVISLLVLFGERRRPQVRGGELRPVLLAAVPGLGAGVLLLEALSQEALQVAGGVLIIAAALAQARAPVPGEPPRPRAPAPGGGVLVGAGIGVLTTATAVNGPPLSLWLLHRGARPAELRDSLAGAFLVLNVLGAATVLLLAGEGLQLEASTLALVPAVLIGHLLGCRVFARLGAAALRAAVLALVLCAGAASVAGGLLG